MTFTFDTTHHALWAEELLRERGLPCEVVPAPPAAHARCNLALLVLPEDAQAAGLLLEEVGVPFKWFPPG